jgi:23S rRNA (guanosine2251-2'-O)-methyltransferase
MFEKLSMDELNRLSINDFNQVKKLPIIVILDNVRSLNNIGSVFRTSDAFLIEEIYLCGISGTPPHREIHKTALGAEFSVKWQHIPETLTAINTLKKAGYKIIAVEQVKNSIMLNEWQPADNEKYAFIFGNEADGVAQSVIDQSDYCLEIPQFGTKHSLNISVSAGVVLWEVSKKIILKQ